MDAPTAQPSRSRHAARRRAPVGRWVAATLATTATLLVSAAALADPAPRPISAERLLALVPSGLDHPHDVPATARADRRADPRARPGSFCTIGTCRPREAAPTRGALAFGGAVLVAGLAGRRRSSRNR